MSEQAQEQTAPEDAPESTVTETCTGCEKVTEHVLRGIPSDDSRVLRCLECGSEDEYPVVSRSPEEVGERIRAHLEAEATHIEQEEALPEKPLRAPPVDPFTRQCPTCQGFGQTQTGSLVDGQEFRECVTCGGRGWQERLEQTPLADGAPGQTEHDDGGWSWR